MPQTAPRLAIRLAAAGAAVLAGIFGCGGGGGGGGGGGAAPPPVPVTTVVVAATVDASVETGALEPLWRDHYDLSYTHLRYAGEPGFPPIVAALGPRSWRCSVGRFEIGTPPPPGADSLDPGVLRAVEREFYRGPSTLAAADDPASYDFAYLDAQLAALRATGAEPFLCFDYTPFTLASVQDPLNPRNLGLSDPAFSFSNGIRTAPPADPAVYARVVRNTVRHVRGLFAGTTDLGIRYVEVGNEPDLFGAGFAPLPIFWTGTRAELMAVYRAVAAEIDADPQLSPIVRLGAASFRYLPPEPAPRFLDEFATDVAARGTRLDFLSFHSYGHDPDAHARALARVRATLAALGLAPELIVAEWARDLGGLPDPAFDRIEHGLFRAKVIALMEAAGVSIAHEALFRDPIAIPGLPGLVATGPARRKPAADVYLGLRRLDDCPRALAVSAPPGRFLIAGRSAGATKVVVAFVVDDPGPGRETRLELTVQGLPFGGGPFDLRRYAVSEATAAAGTGVRLEEDRLLSGDAVTATLTVGAGDAQLAIFELERR